MKQKKKTQQELIPNKWKLEKTSLGSGCFVDGKSALTQKEGDPKSGNYSNKVIIKDGKRLLCSSYLEGSQCLGKGGLGEKSWDYLVVFLKNKLNRQDYIKKNCKNNIVSMLPEHEIYLAFLEVHGDAGDVLEKYKWLSKKVIQDVSRNYKTKYKVFWLKSGQNEPTKERQRQMNESPIKQISNSLNLDLEFN